MYDTVEHNYQGYLLRTAANTVLLSQDLCGKGKVVFHVDMHVRTVGFGLLLYVVLFFFFGGGGGNQGRADRELLGLPVVHAIKT